MQPTHNPVVVDFAPTHIFEVSESQSMDDSLEEMPHLASEKGDDITWIHAALIISAIFIFFCGWVCIFCFIYSQKKKSREALSHKAEAKTSINHLTVIGQEIGNDDEEGSGLSGYHSQSALDHAIDIDEHSVTQHHIAKFLNIVKTSDIFEGNHHGYSLDIGSKLSKFSRRTTETYCVNAVQISDVDLSETLDTDSEETETSNDTNCHLEVVRNKDQRKDSHSIDI